MQPQMARHCRRSMLRAERKGVNTTTTTTTTNNNNNNNNNDNNNKNSLV